MKKSTPLSEILKYSLKALSVYGAGVFTVLLGYFMLIKLTQGQDVLMQAGEAWGAFLFSLVAILSWAFFVWYSSRLIGYQKKFNNKNWPLEVISTMPRLLAYNAFVSVQAATLALPTILNLSFWWLALYVVGHNVYFFFLSHFFKRGKSAKGLVTATVVLVGLAYSIGLVILTLNKADASAHEKHLPLIALLLFGLQVFSLFLFIVRRTTLDDNAGSHFDNHAVEYVTFLKLKLIKVPAWFKAQEQTTFSLFNYLAIVASVCYGAASYSIRVADWLGPLAVVLLAFGILAGAFNIITYLSLRCNVNLFLILLVLAWLVGELAPDFYTVQLSNASAPQALNHRPDLKAYFDNWIYERKAELEQADSVFPVYFVLADGGASRSGYWVASVLSAWQEHSVNSKYPLHRHVFSLSGASGGGVGNASFYALLSAKQPQEEYLKNARNFLKRDFLSYCLAHYLGPDILQHFFPLFRSHDRAAAISETMDYWAKKDLSVNFTKNVEDVFDASGKLPILCVNVTRVQKGVPSVISSVKLKSFSKRIDVLEVIDRVDDNKKKSITLSTAAVMGARFPYVSPAGKIGEEYFVDGGYFDNSGAGVTYEMMNNLDSLIQTETNDHKQKLYSKLQFTLVHITNSPKTSDIKPMHPLVNDLMAPLITVFSTYASQTDANDYRIKQYVQQRGGKVVNINLYEDGENEYPMNWVISKYRLQKMDERLEKAKTNEIKNLMENN
jgi:hypothetical protein